MASPSRLVLEHPAVAEGGLRLSPFLGSPLRVVVLLLFLPCVNESDAVRIDGDLSVALALAVSPLGCGDSSLHENKI